MLLAVDVPALRRVREEQGTHTRGDVGEIRKAGPPVRIQATGGHEPCKDCMRSPSVQEQKVKHSASLARACDGEEQEHADPALYSTY